MRIVITGAAGYIGSKLSAYFLNNGHDVSVFDNYFFKQQYEVKNVFKRFNCHHYQEDVTEWSDNLKYAIENADLIFPLAALVGAPLCDKYPEKTIAINQEWFNQLIPYLNEQKVIYPNTNSGYGSTGPGVCTEETPCNPISLYGKTKAEAERILLEKYNNAVCFRLATVYGRSYRQRMDLLVNNLVYTAMKKRHIELFDGHFRRNYIHVDDIVRAFTHAYFQHSKMKNNVYNLGNDAVNKTKEELVKNICLLTGAEYSKITNKTDPDKRDYVVSSHKLHKTGFSAKFDLEYGIKEMMTYIAFNMYKLDDEQYMNICRNY